MSYGSKPPILHDFLPPLQDQISIPLERLNPVYNHPLDPDPLLKSIDRVLPDFNLTSPSYIHPLDPNPAFSVLRQRESSISPLEPRYIHPLDPDPAGSLLDALPRKLKDF